uniref:N-acetyltransferase domain-containing protein n=1 Tax=Steinernema glaseri TaxID=37863 RepID=A0A1I7YN57_9BILA
MHQKSIDRNRLAEDNHLFYGSAFRVIVREPWEKVVGWALVNFLQGQYVILIKSSLWLIGLPYTACPHG